MIAFGTSERRWEASARMEMSHDSCSTANGLTRAVNPSLDEIEDTKAIGPNKPSAAVLVQGTARQLSAAVIRTSYPRQ